MTRIEKIKEYMNICCIDNATEIKRYGDYPKTYQFLNGVFTGKYHLSDDEEKMIYRCINIARFNKQKGIRTDEKKDKDDSIESSEA